MNNCGNQSIDVYCILRACLKNTPLGRERALCYCKGETTKKKWKVFRSQTTSTENSKTLVPPHFQIFQLALMLGAPAKILKATVTLIGQPHLCNHKS